MLSQKRPRNLTIYKESKQYIQRIEIAANLHSKMWVPLHRVGTGTLGVVEVLVAHHNVRCPQGVPLGQEIQNLVEKVLHVKASDRSTEHLEGRGL